MTSLLSASKDAFSNHSGIHSLPAVSEVSSTDKYPVVTLMNKYPVFTDLLNKDGSLLQFIQRSVREHQVVLTLIANRDCENDLVGIQDAYDDYRIKYSRKLTGAQALECCPSDQTWLEPPCTYEIWQSHKSYISRHSFSDGLDQVLNAHWIMMEADISKKTAYNSLRDKVFGKSKPKRVRRSVMHMQELRQMIENGREADRKERLDHARREMEADIATRTAIKQLDNNIKNNVDSKLDALKEQGVETNKTVARLTSTVSNFIIAASTELEKAHSAFHTLANDYKKNLDALNGQHQKQITELTLAVMGLREQISSPGYAPIRSKAEKKKNCCDCRGMCSGGVGVKLANKCPCILQGKGCKTRCRANICCSQEEIKRGENVLQTGRRVSKPIDYLNPMA